MSLFVNAFMQSLWEKRSNRVKAKTQTHIFSTIIRLMPTSASVCHVRWRWGIFCWGMPPTDSCACILYFANLIHVILNSERTPRFFNSFLNMNQKFSHFYQYPSFQRYCRVIRRRTQPNILHWRKPVQTSRHMHMYVWVEVMIYAVTETRIHT